MTSLIKKTLVAGAMALTLGAGMAAAPGAAEARGFGGGFHGGGFHGGGFGGHSFGGRGFGGRGFGGRGFGGRGFAGRGFAGRGFGGRYGYGYGRGFGYRGYGYGLGGGLLLGAFAANSYYGGCARYAHNYYGRPVCGYYHY